MKKPTKLLLFFLTSSLLMVILYWNNSEHSIEEHTNTTGTLVDQCNVRIDSLGRNKYLDAFYKELKRDISGMHSAQELSDEEKDGLIGNLEIDKMNSLILSFDDVKNNACMNAGGLAKWSKLLRIQEKIVPNPEARNRITAYGNLISFLGQRGAVSSFLASEFTTARYNALKSRIQQLAVSSGVSECGTSSSIKNDLINQLEGFQSAYKDFLGMQDGTLPCLPGYRDNFENYLYYYNISRCPN